MKSIKLLFVALMLSTLFNACKDDDGCNATYEGEVKAIIDKSCAYSGCHSGADASMFVSDNSKDYTTYEGMKLTLDDGTFNTRTLEELNMPPAMFVPEGNPIELTEEELEILTCWKDNGFPKD